LLKEVLRELTLIVGVDDAGRGPVIGPLVIAGILVNDSQIPRLKALGVKDSKVLTPRQRERLSAEIKQLVLKYTWAELSPLEVDRIVLEGAKLKKLNWLEAKTMAEVIERLKPEVAYVDASDVNEARFARDILEFLSVKIPIISEHRADSTYPVVSAASIIAKVHRDEAVAELRRIYGDFGSGYPSDPKTRRFLSDWIGRNKTLPDFVRKSWKTISHLTKEERQQNL
jgi:ribonuclease HII